MGPGARAFSLAVVTVEEPFRDFLAFWGQAREHPAADQVALWERLYAQRHRAALALYEEAFGHATRLEDALPRYAAVAGELEARFAALDLEGSARAVGDLLGTAGPFRAIALVGTFTANAWWEDFEGAATAFFALEQVPPDGRARVLALHEFAHAAHQVARASAWPAGLPALDLLQEGVAVAVTRRLAPEQPLEQHFGVPDFAAWERTCDAKWAPVVEELLARPEVADEQAQVRFFWPDWGRPDRDVPERCGYLVAGRVIDALLKRDDLAAVVRWPADRARAEVRGALASLA